MIIVLLQSLVFASFFSAATDAVQSSAVLELNGQVEIELEGRGDTYSGEFAGHKGEGKLILQSRGKRIKNNLDITINGKDVAIHPSNLRQQNTVKIDISEYMKQGDNELKVVQRNNALSPKLIIPYLTLKEGAPEDVGMSLEKLDKIDGIVQQSINDGIIPGGVVLVAKDGVIVKESSYGDAQNYDMGQLLEEPRLMETDTIFDLASVTKVLGTTQGIMKLVSDGKLNVEDKVADIIPAFGQEGKEAITIEDLLTHTSGLTPWAPTYYYANNSEGVLDYINSMPLDYETGTNRAYSDFSFMMLGFIIEEVSGQKLNQYLEEDIYKTIELKDTQFTPSSDFTDRIASTSWGNPYEYKMVHDPDFGYKVDVDLEAFDSWRDYTLTGEVNDGKSFYANEGVAGHAGLFSTARDLSVLGQLMLNGGGYGNNKLYSHPVVEQFTSPQRSGHGYGWEVDSRWYMGDERNSEAFGHTGFTRTQVIFDPAEQLQIIILTNKQNMGTISSGSYFSTGPLSRNITDTVYQSIKE
ncbi:serine hydrolase [Salipaludibacillus sp. CUR1]|uniref:serine hydrolase n=1 Tax=Salipaludibacillus sp. CUR1 TaxID=2820003 RepID=UPI001E4B260C|nr:serine hydrolase [Salipaludibacillus sp. CUR1]MCE7791733.1 serine hydrolase [Salipaludibacillus sp. CUR1]